MPDLVRAAHSTSRSRSARSMRAAAARQRRRARMHGVRLVPVRQLRPCARDDGIRARKVIAAHAGPAGRSVAELLRADLGPTARGVGPATHFVSWHVGQRLVELFDALDK